MKTIIYKLDFEINSLEVYNLVAASKIDKSSQDFIDFEESLDLIFQTRGYEMKETYDSPNPNSCTRYYTYVKVEGNTQLKALVSVRVSDHFANDKYDRFGNRIPEFKVRNRYVANKAKELAERIGSDNTYLARSVNIVFNNTKYETYDDALHDVQKRIDSYEELIR